ncbi:MAG: hypothetical protein ACOCU8_01805 [Patescibacteria group bacterium]
MTEDEKEKLEKSLHLAEENNKMLKSMSRSIRWGFIFTVTKWIIVVGAALGLYYFLQPVINPLMDIYSGAWSAVGELEEVFNGIRQ